MSKDSIRLFFIAFSVTLLLCGFAVVFLLVDYNSAGRSARPAAALSSDPVDPLHYEITLLGDKITLSLERLERSERLRHEHACLLTPRALLTAEQAADAARYGWDAFYRWYLDEAFRREALDQNPIPG